MFQVLWSFIFWTNNLLFSIIFGICMTLQCCLFLFFFTCIVCFCFPRNTHDSEMLGLRRLSRCADLFMHKHTFKSVILLWHGQYWHYEEKNLMHVKPVFGIPVYFMSKDSKSPVSVSKLASLCPLLPSVCCWLAFPGADSPLTYHCGYASWARGRGCHSQWRGLVGADSSREWMNALLTEMVERPESTLAV